MFRNPLIGPEIAGVSSGATLGGVIALALGWSPLEVVGLAFASGLLALFATFGLATIAGCASTLAIVLSGIVIGGFCGAIAGLIKTLVDSTARLPSIVYWQLGSFVRRGRRW